MNSVPDETEAIQIEFKLTLSNDQMMVTAAALHLLSHFAKNPGEPLTTINEVRNMLIDGIPNNIALGVDSEIAEFAMDYMSCAKAEFIHALTRASLEAHNDYAHAILMETFGDVLSNLDVRGLSSRSLSDLLKEGM